MEENTKYLHHIAKKKRKNRGHILILYYFRKAFDTPKYSCEEFSSSFIFILILFVYFFLIVFIYLKYCGNNSTSITSDMYLHTISVFTSIIDDNFLSWYSFFLFLFILLFFILFVFLHLSPTSNIHNFLFDIPFFFSLFFFSFFLLVFVLLFFVLCCRF